MKETLNPKPHGWLSKIMAPLFGYPEYLVPHDNKDPKRDPDIDNHPMKNPDEDPKSMKF